MLLLVHVCYSVSIQWLRGKAMLTSFPLFLFRTNIQVIHTSQTLRSINTNVSQTQFAKRSINIERPVCRGRSKANAYYLASPCTTVSERLRRTLRSVISVTERSRSFANTNANWTHCRREHAIFTKLLFPPFLYVSFVRVIRFITYRMYDFCIY